MWDSPHIQLLRSIFTVKESQKKVPQKRKSIKIAAKKITQISFVQNNFSKKIRVVKNLIDRYLSTT